MAVKKCGICKKEKEINKFYKDKSRKDGLRRCCKECDKRSGKKWRKENQEHVNKYWREFRKKILV